MLKKIIILPILCILLITGCKSSNISDKDYYNKETNIEENYNQTKVTKLQALYIAKDYMKTNNIYNPNYILVIGDEVSNQYIINIYYQKYENGFLDNIYVGNFKIDSITGKVISKISILKESGVYKLENKEIYLPEGY